MKDEFKLRKEHISKVNSAQDIFDLFKHLNYSEKILSSKRKKDTFDFKKEDAQRIKEIYSILSFDEKLPVFLIESKTLVPSFIRSVTTTFDKQYLHFLLIFATDYSEVVFVFPKREKIEAGKHKLRLTKLILNKRELYYTDIQTLSNMYFEKEETWRDVWRKWNKAFSVERVTEAFFEDYKNIFFTLRKELNKQKESHEFTLQFLNRIMFIYFISKKKWLEYPKFIDWLWTSYKKLNKYGSDEFHEKWLRQVFFKAFNNRADEITNLPEDVVKVIASSPYLNGGLFRQNGLDDLKIKISDSLFQKIFDFFEKYNFTIKEGTPLDSEVAVDPQMIGYVYESLANVAEKIYDRNDLGIFYTPRVEVDFMCRRSVVEYLSKQLPDIPKDKFYHIVFDLPEEKEKIEKWFDKEKLWYKLEEVLDNLSAVDPACGSGAFLVGLLNVLSEIYKLIYKHIKRELSDFELKNKIIQYSLYGVDVMPGAIHAAELRLWLQLIVETEFKKDELRKHPLFPNLNLNLRIGDSLVQEIGGISFNVRTNSHLKKNSPTAPEEIIDERDPEKKPFVWDIDFAEIFGDKNGFDIVIGNPPYVPYKKISPPNIPKTEVTKEQKREYKEKLIESVKTQFDVVSYVNGMSDYYIYFYFHGLSLLNQKGTFCFITSNFWLDVDYGKELQEFLIKYVPIYGIYDCSKRSFAHALINTVIVFFGAPNIKQRKKTWPAIKHIAKFVMFKKPFEEVLSAKNLIEIDKIKIKKREEDDYRIFPVFQGDLLEDGWEYPESYDKKKGRFKVGSYTGNKWGGKYLRAPDIFFDIISNEKVIKLSKICNVKTGLKESGYSDYIKPVEVIKEKKNYLPILKNIRKLNKIEITFHDSYIIKNISHFKSSTKDKHSRILWPAMRGDKHYALFNPHEFTFTGNFFGIEPINSKSEKGVLLVLNSSVTFLLFEILARKGFGGGSAIMVKSDLDNHMVIINPERLKQKKINEIISKISRREIKPIFEELGINPNKPIREQEPKPLPDRAELDKIIFDELGLTKEERKEVYWAICELVKQRLEKARSLRG